MGKIKLGPGIGEEDVESVAIPLLVHGGKFNPKTEKLPDSMPLLLLSDKVLLPGSILPIPLNNDQTSSIIRHVDDNKSYFAVSLIKPDTDENVNNNDKMSSSLEFFEIGTLAKVIRIIELPDGNRSALIRGCAKIEIIEPIFEDPFNKAKIKIIKERAVLKSQTVKFEASCSLIRDLTKSILKKSIGLSAPPELMFAMNNIDFNIDFVNLVACSFEINILHKQRILEENSHMKKALILLSSLDEQMQHIELKSKIQQETHKQMDKQQKEYLLQQQLKTIQNELGNSTESVYEELVAKSKTKHWKPEVQDVFNNELAKLQRMNINSQELSLQVDYLENMLSLPWNEYSDESIDISNAEKQLNADHFGLDKVKERILEHMAVYQLRNDMKSPIMCLYGPPGVGKTSLGKSIAEALGRKYVRVSLGGLHDESEIRGHRRTYLGSMMGRILQGIKKAGTSNPVFLLDEVDKITKSGHGDPESALLEVLDPEQNSTFYDNYLGIEYDLSKVLFIATANNVQNISQPLKDRMEMIDVSGYIAEEKIEIATRHLLPKQMECHGINKDTFSISKQVMDYIINNYTRESGVRGLDNTLASICRKMALKIAKGEKFDNELTEADIRTMLGIETVSHDLWEDDMVPGVVTGLAWTAVGGEILFVETTKSKGKGIITLTGNLGDVMKESATIALEYVRCNAEKFGLSDINFDETNIYIHVPEGAVPKDGPSAGITMVTSIVSALTGKKVKKRFAMTGEISLRGNVLPVGGIKEKILAAKRAGITDIIMSETNKKDLTEINEMYIKGLNFHTVKHIEDVVKLALEE